MYAVTAVMGLDFMTDRSNSGDGDSIHGSTALVVMELMLDVLFNSHMDLSEQKNITEHLLTDNELFFSFVYFKPTVHTSFHNHML